MPPKRVHVLTGHRLPQGRFPSAMNRIGPSLWTDQSVNCRWRRLMRCHSAVFARREDGCIAPMIRKPIRPRPTSPDALLHPYGIGLPFARIPASSKTLTTACPSASSGRQLTIALLDREGRGRLVLRHGSSAQVALLLSYEAIPGTSTTGSMRSSPRTPLLLAWRCTSGLCGVPDTPAPRKQSRRTAPAGAIRVIQMSPKR